MENSFTHYHSKPKWAIKHKDYTFLVASYSYFKSNVSFELELDYLYGDILKLSTYF